MKFEDLPIGFRREAGGKLADIGDTLDNAEGTKGKDRRAYKALRGIVNGLLVAGQDNLADADYPPTTEFDVVTWLHDMLCRYTWDPGDDEDVRCQVAMAEFEARCRHAPYDAAAELKRRSILPQIMAKFPRVKPSYVYCGICGHVPKDDKKPNLGPVSWYDPDDGTCFGTLCPACAYQTLDRVPKSSDYCMQEDGQVPFSMQNTDEDITHLLS